MTTQLLKLEPRCLYTPESVQVVGTKTARLRHLWMKASMLLIVGVSALVGCAAKSVEPSVIKDDKPIRFASFNIHYLAQGQKKLNWDHRKRAVTEALRKMNADIIAVQEMETFAGGSYNVRNKQLEWIRQELPEYTAGAFGHAAEYPNTQPILFRADRFEQKEQGFFYFSDTPEVIYSRTFNGSWPAFCSWSRIFDRRSQNEFTVFNIHFEYKSMGNRKKSALLVKSRIEPLVAAGKPVVLMGDVNAPSFAPTTNKLESIPLTLARPAGATFHFNRGLNILPAIDHILFSAGFAQYGKLRRSRSSLNGVWPSDHYPIYVDLSFR